MSPSRLLVLIALATLAEAGDDLSDFTNNLAQDLGPLLALFGETVTKQYLSESTTYLDYFIFGMGPLGIITAVVSVIRVCGHPSLRAFIGRSKEGEAAVEAELCPSTSRDVCELFHKGGIARVLGRSDILELVCVSDKGSSDQPSEASTRAGERPNQRPNSTASDKGSSEEVSGSNVSSVESRYKRKRLATFKKYLRVQEGTSPIWKRTRGSVFSPRDAIDQDHIFTAPNLTLNIGIKRPPLWVLFTVAISGLVLQSGVVVLAGFGAWRLGWKQDETSSGTSKDYAPRMFIAGTLMLCLGMWGCATLIGQATQEVRYKRRRDVAHESTRLIWLQPGPQRVGEQSFDACSYFENENDQLAYWVSSRKRKGSEKVFELLTYAAVFSSVVGYVLQFIGLRGMKAWVSLAQLGLTLFMSLLRGSLRIQRVRMKQNRLSKMPDLVAGHELDWLAFELAFEKSPMQAMGQPQKGTSWHVSSRNTRKTERNFSVYEATRQQDYSGSISSGAISHGNETLKTFVTSPGCQDLCRDLFDIRAQLSRITGLTDQLSTQGSDLQWTDDVVNVRRSVRRLAKAIGQVATDLLEWDGKGLKKTMTIPVDAVLCMDSDMLACALPQTIGVELSAFKTSHQTWFANSSHVEAILGLWMWSIISSRNSLREDEYGNTVANALGGLGGSQILSVGLDNELWSRDVDFEVELGFWLGPDGHNVSTLKRQYPKNLPCGLFTAPFPIDGKGWKTRVAKHEWNIAPNYERLFGWNLLNEALDVNDVDPISKSVLVDAQHKVDDHVPVKIQYLNKPRRLLDLCTQHLFITLVKEMIRLSAINISQSTVSERGGFIEFQNPLVNTLEKAFVESHLGTRADAVTTIVSQFRKQLTPDDESIVSSIIHHANSFRLRGQWSRAEVLLRWGCQHISPALKSDRPADLEPRCALFERTLTAALELYRWSAASERHGERMQFAKHGIAWVSQLCNALSKDVDHTVHNAFLQRVDTMKSRYADVLQRLENTPDKPRITGQAHPFIHALQDSSRPDALYHLSLLEIGDIGFKALKPALPLAVRNQWSEIVDALFELKAHADDVDESGRTAASYCAELGLASLMRQLADRGAFLDLSDHQSQTPLHWAAFSGQIQIVNMLLEIGGVDLSRQDQKGIVPLWHAIYADQPAIVQAILDKGFSARFQSEKETSPLHWAAEHGQVDIVQILLNNDAEINRTETRYEVAPLHVAVKHNHEAVVRLLLDAGAEVDKVDSNTRTALHYAALEGSSCNIVRLLLAAGADVKWLDSFQKSILHRAAHFGHSHLIDILVEAGADIEGRDGHGNTPLHSATSWIHHGDRSTVVLKLLELGASVDSLDDHNCTPLYEAASYGNPQCFKPLASYGANPNHVTGLGNTVLGRAVAKDNPDTVKLLVEIGADVNQPDGDGLTPLANAIKSYRFKAVKTLLDLGANKIDLKSAREGIGNAHSFGYSDLKEFFETKVRELEDIGHDEASSPDAQK